MKLLATVLVALGISALAAAAPGLIADPFPQTETTVIADPFPQTETTVISDPFPAKETTALHGEPSSAFFPDPETETSRTLIADPFPETRTVIGDPFPETRTLIGDPFPAEETTFHGDPSSAFFPGSSSQILGADGENGSASVKVAGVAMIGTVVLSSVFLAVSHWH